MNTTSFALVVWITLMAVSGALADNQPKNAKEVDKGKAKGTKPTSTEASSSLTGSYLKQRVRRDGQIVESPNHVLVIDSEAIRLSGGSSVLEVLGRRGTLR